MAVDVAKHYAPCVQKKVKRKLTPNQFSSVVSFVYNLGCGGSFRHCAHSHARARTGERAKRSEGSGCVHSLHFLTAWQADRLSPIHSTHRFRLLISARPSVHPPTSPVLKGNILAAIESGNGQAVASKMLEFNKAGGRPLAGLTRRRRAEGALYLSKAPGTCYQ